MSLLDELLGAAKGGVSTIAGTPISQAQSAVNIGLTNLLNSAMPNVNRIPGAGRARDAITGAILQQVGAASSIPTKMVGDGVQQVFDAIGVSMNSNLPSVNPTAYNGGVTAAKNLWSNVNDGQMPINEILLEASPALTATRYAHDNLPGVTDLSTPASSTRYSPYAMDLFRLAPKHKFLYVTEFVFNSGYDFIGQGTDHKNQFALVIQEFERPKIKYEYEDNVNYYNFRTKIVKRVIHDPLTIKFLDDRQNLSMKFFHEYLKATHPITAVAPESSPFYENNGMNFGSDLDSSSSAALTDNNITILKEIRVYHLYDFGAKMNTYHFMNPKMVSVELDNWAMHDSEGSNIVAQFGYDGLSMELGITVGASQESVIETLSNAGQYPLHPRQTGATEFTQSTVPRDLSSNLDLGPAGSDPLGAFLEMNGYV